MPKLTQEQIDALHAIPGKPGAYDLKFLPGIDDQDRFDIHPSHVIPGKPGASNLLMVEGVDNPVSGKKNYLLNENNYQSTFPITPYSPGYVDLDENARKQFIQQKMAAKNSSNPALDKSLPKKFVGKNDPKPAVLPSRLPAKPGKSSVLKDVPESSVAFPGQTPVENPFFDREQPGLNLTMPSAATDTMSPILGGYDANPQDQPNLTASLMGEQPLPSATVMGTVPKAEPQAPVQTVPEEDPRQALRARLLNRNQDMLDRMSQARDYNVIGQLAPILAQASSKMGTLQGKRADVADFQPYLKALYDRNMGAVTDEMGMEDRQDAKLYKQAQIASMFAKAQKQQAPTSPKVLPYYKPPTKDQPGEVLMYDNQGRLIPQQLPPGYEPNNPWTTLPIFQDANGRPVIMQQNPVTGETRKLQLPDDLKALDQIKQQTQSRLAQIRLDMQIASEDRKNELRREEARLSARMAEIREKEFGLREKSQAETERANREREKIQREKIGSNDGAKRLSPSNLAKYGEGRNMANVINTFRNSFKQYSSLIGPVKGRLGGLNPYDVNVQKFQADVKRTAQTVGKFMEGGVLRKEDEVKYEKMLPALTDLPQVAAYKLDQLDAMVSKKHADDLSALKAQGYDTSGLEIPSKKQEVDRRYNKKTNKTHVIFNDGSEEVLNGRITK